MLFRSQVFEYAKSSTDVRKEWSSTIDTVVRERPVFVQRTHDSIVMLNTYTLKNLFDDLKYDVSLYNESDGSVTCVIEQFDLVENVKRGQSAIDQIVAAIRDYADDFYNDFELWSKAPNRRAHIPYVLNIIASTDSELKEKIVCRDGKN